VTTAIKCYDCSEPPAEGRVRCEVCRKKNAERARTYAAKKLVKPLTVTLAVERALTTGQIARICSVAPRTVSKWIDSERLPGYRIPGSKDRRVKPPDLVTFLREHGFTVPRELCEPADVAVGVAGPVEWFRPLATVFDLGVLSATGPIRALVVGDADGLQLAVTAARAVRAANPAAKIALLLDPASAGFVPPAGVFDRVAVRPCDLAALAVELTTGTEGITRG
jgi:two-component system response regulator RpaA